MAFEILRPLDKLAAGRHANYRVNEHMLDHPRTLRTFRGIRLMLAAEVVVSLTAIVLAIVFVSTGQTVAWVVWFRCAGVLGITLTLFYFATRASEGYYWAFQRIKLFSWIFPVVTLVVSVIPGLYPLWMIVEQAVFSLLLVGIGDLLRSEHMIQAFPKPGAAGRTA